MVDGLIMVDGFLNRPMTSGHIFHGSTDSIAVELARRSSRSR